MDATERMDRGTAPASAGGYRDLTCDVVIAGCGVAGLYAALSLPADCNVVMLSKGAVEECDSMLAQGGICVLPEAGDYDSFFEDTLRAGHYENRRESVDIMIRSSRAVINDLVALGVAFNREADGGLAFTREGAHARPRIVLESVDIMIRSSRAVINDLVALGVAFNREADGGLAFTREGAHARPRIVFHQDVTGEAITTALLAQVRRLGNVRILEHAAMVDLLVEDGACAGVRVRAVSEAESEQTVDELLEGEAGACTFDVRAGATILATGGIGGVYQHSTNFPQLTGDAIYLSSKYGIENEHLDYVQIHPTGLYSPEPGRAFLISESCRGEGAILLNHAGERFTDELQPRDVVAAAMREEMRAEGVDHEWLSFAPVDPEVVRDHFANIRQRCLDEGRDILEEPIPVVPTQHYFMGGIHVDRDSATSMPRLYAAGETSCNGVHGANRLASNSLLEALVFAARAAHRIVTGESLAVPAVGEPALDGVHRRGGAYESAMDVLCGASGCVAARG